MTVRAEATTMVKRCPCDGCGHFARCGQESLACSRFIYFHRTGDVRLDLRASPTKGHYARMLGDDAAGTCRGGNG